MGEKKLSLLSRRDFLKLAGAGALLVGASAFYLKHPDFFKKVNHSITTGKALKDMDEIFKSRIAQMTDVQLFNLDEPNNYKEDWMDKVCEDTSVYILQDGTNIGFFDITNTCSAKPVKETLVNGKTYFSLGQTLANSPPSMTLPNPIYEGTDQIYTKFSLYAGYSTPDGNFDTRASSRKDPAPHAGGLVIVDGKSIITTPEEFISFYNEKQNTEALIQYGFVVDSATLETDLSEIKGVDTLKNQAYTGEFANCLVTLYKEQKMNTFMVSVFSPFDELKKTFGQKPQELNIVQMVDLVNKFAIKNSSERFVIAFPDPSTIGSCSYTPIHYELDKVEPRLIENYSKSIRSYAVGQEGGQEKNVSFFRTLGSYSQLVYPNDTLPFIITSSKSNL